MVRFELRKRLGERMSTKKSASQFVDVSSSGAVSVKLGGYLRSADGQKQLKDIRQLKSFAIGSGSLSGGRAGQSTRNKK